MGGGVGSATGTLTHGRVRDLMELELPEKVQRAIWKIVEYVE